MAAELTLHPQAIAVRIVIPETGWATGSQLLSRLDELGVRYLALDDGGARAVALPENVERWTERFGELSRELDELATVELRDDVALIVGAVATSGNAATALCSARASLEHADVPLRGAFASGSEFALLVDRWRSNSAAAALEGP